MRRLPLGIAAAVVLALGDVAAAAPLPNIAASDAGTLKTFRPDGTTATTLPTTSWWSIGDTRVAIDSGTGANDTVAVRDARTGAPRYTIANAFRPIVLPKGEIGFWPGRNLVRDPLLDSLWIRRADGSIRKLLQLPGGDDTLLSSAFDGTARRAVVASGNDVDLFRYDVWLRDRRTAKTKRLTRDHRSRWPSLRSDGAIVAYSRERGVCADGVRASDIVLLTLSNGNRRTLTRGSCARTYPQPVWLTNGFLISYRGRRIGGAWTFDLVRVRTSTGVRTAVPRSTGGTFSVSQRQRLVAFDRVGGGIEVVDRKLATVKVLPNASGPALAGDLRN
jgi:hypothetical protein